MSYFWSKIALQILFATFLCKKVKSYSYYNYYERENYPVNLTASVGDHAVFNCFVNFPKKIPIPYMINWKKGDETIFSWYEGVVTSSEPYTGRIELVAPPSESTFSRYLGNRRVYGRAALNLTAIRESDSGMYECQIVFPNRTPSTRPNGTFFHLTVSGGNLLAIPPVNQTVLEGNEVSFVCLTKNPDYGVHWYKDGVPLREFDELVRRSWLTNENTLIIKPTSMTDSGYYECEVVNSKDGERQERQTAKAFLNIQYKAKVIYSPPELYLPFGRAAVIDCHFRANPPLTDLRWEKDGFLYDPYNIQGVFYRRNGSLYITNVDDTHQGRYTCTPYNELGTQGASAAILVRVQHPPMFVHVPHNLYLKKVGESVQMPCEARDGGYEHQPTVVWYKKDGTSLPAGRYSITPTGNLTIIEIQDSDRGVYQCSASNNVATITVDTELLVETSPSGAPTHLDITSPTATSIRVRWQAAGGRVRNSPQNGGEKNTGRSPAERFTSVSNTKSHLKNYNYSVWYKSVANAEWKTVLLPQNSTKMEVVIENLAPNSEYELMVLCHDENGEGLFSKTHLIHTQQNAKNAKSAIYDDVEKNETLLTNFESTKHNSDDIIDMQHVKSVHNGPPIGYPRNLSVHATKNGGFLVMWTPPAYGTEFLKTYLVRWYQKKHSYLFGVAETLDTSFMLKGLIEGIEYNVQVIAITYDDQQVVSDTVALNVPPVKYIRANRSENRHDPASSGTKQIKAISTGIICGVVFIVLAIVAIQIYKKKRPC